MNLENLTCSCRYWELSGLPCSHAISAIYTVGKDLEEYIAPCYRVDVYDQIYNHVLQPVEGKESWPVASNPRPFPPIKMKQPGRPKTERRREEGEKPKGTKLSKKGIIIRCSMCGGQNHNKRKCTGNPDAVREHAHQAKVAKRSRKNQDKTTDQQAHAHVQQPHAPLQQSLVQQANTKVHVPPKRNYKKKASVTGEGARSQPVPCPTQSSQASVGHISRSQQIPMSQVVTEPVPKSGRMKWYLSAGQSVEGGEGGDGAP